MRPLLGRSEISWIGVGRLELDVEVADRAPAPAPATSRRPVR